MDFQRTVAAAFLGVVGAVLFAPNADYLLRADLADLSAFVLALLGTAVSLALVGGALWLYVGDFETAAAVRVAAWTTAGLTLVGFVLLVAGRTDVVDVPQFFAAGLLAITAFAHVVIGVTDVRRIRAEELASEREKSAVFTRVLRHNLRTEAQLLAGVADATGEQGERVERRGAALAALSDAAAEIDAAIDRDPTEAEPVAVVDLVADAAADVRAANPDATVETRLPESCRALGGPQVRVAVRELLANAVEHGAGTVTASLDCDGGARLTVADEGEGVPESERRLLSGGAAESALEHSSGLGLWTAKWIAESYGGRLRFAPEVHPSAVVLSLPGATGAP